MVNCEKNSSNELKKNLLKITEKMPKNEALAFIDRYKDGIKYKDKLEKARKTESIGEVIKKIMSGAPRKRVEGSHG